jgi:hypothetical protein
VRVAVPRDDAELVATLRSRDYGVLHLAQSAVIAREDRMAELAATIQRVRQSLTRPLLQILVSGRAFAENPGLSTVVGAGGDGLGQDSDVGDLQAMLRWAGARGWLPEAVAAQAAVDKVARQLLRGQFPEPHAGD